jgi:hypothetical protein
MDYTTMLHGWANPDIPTLHHPYALAAEGPDVYVTSWSGKVQRLAWQPDSGPRIFRLDPAAMRTDVRFTSPFGSRTYRVEGTSNPEHGPWTTVSGAVIQQMGEGVYQAQCPATGASQQFYRIHVRP